jgi:hypothetical protein
VVVKQSTRKVRLRLFCYLTMCLMLAVCALTLPLCQPNVGVVTDSSIAVPFLPLASEQPASVRSSDGSAPARRVARAAFEAMPLAFEVNQGQADAQVKYMARAHGYTLFLTSNEAIFAMPVGAQSSLLSSLRRDTGPSEILHALHAPKAEASSTPVAMLHMRIRGANPQPVIVAEGQQPGKTNYIIGNDPRRWHNDISRFARVHYRNIYPGIDAVYHGAQQLEFDFLVNAGADPDQIELGFEGAQRMTTDNAGNLVLSSQAGQIRLLQPVAYQEKDGIRQPVKAHFILEGKNGVTFALGPYDRTRQLVIDPSISFATYFGGTQGETGLGVALDAAGNAYVVGASNSNVLPGATNSLFGIGGAQDCYLVQFTPSGRVGFITVFGGTLVDLPQAVAVDSTGIYVAGVTLSTDFPATPGSAQPTFGGAGVNGDGDAFVAKLGLSGSSILWATYLGGKDLDVAFGLALDSSQNVFVVGQTFSTTGFPVVNSLPQGSANNGASDGFVSEVKSDGSAFLMSSYIGGVNLDVATGVAWNSTTGNIYVTGRTQSPNLPFTLGAFQSQCGTGPGQNCNQTTKGDFLDDAFVAAFNPNSPSTYTYLTYLGGESADGAFAITTDASGNAYVTGKTGSVKFPVNGIVSPYQSTLNGVQNAFVSELNPTGTGLVYSTYLGGEGSDKGFGIALDASNNAWVTGQTTSTKFPNANPTQQAFGGGNSSQFNSDAFLSELSSNGTSVSLPFSTYIGGAGDEDIQGGFLATDSTGDVYVVGDTNSTNLPIQVSSTGSLADSSLNGGRGLQPTCQVLNQQTQQQLTIACPDAFVERYTANTSGILVTVAGAGIGSVSSNPGGIKCPGVGTCSASFGNSTQVALTATPAAGSAFAGWSGGGCSGPAACSMALTANQFVTATFNLNPAFTIAGTALSPSAVSPGGSATSNLTVNSVGGFNSSVSFSCTITPAVSPAPTCSASAATPPANGKIATTLTVNTTPAGAASLHPAFSNHSGPWYAMWLPVSGLAFVGAGFGSANSRKKKLLGFMLLCLVLSGFIFSIACSGGGSKSNGGGGTPAGLYTVTVTGASGSLKVNSGALTFTVQ